MKLLVFLLHMILASTGKHILRRLRPCPIYFSNFDKMTVDYFDLAIDLFRRL